MNNLTIIVNSSDGFEDCWEPFFKLFTTYWKDCPYPILLNTEKKEYKYKGLDLKASQVSLDIDRRLTWSECLIKAIEQANTSYVLYLQEDYFIEQPINAGLIESFLKLMQENEEIKYIGLTDSGNSPPFYDFVKDDRLKIVSRKSRYRISTQAAIWRSDTFLSYLRPEENGWMFEIYGSKRAQKRSDLFLTVDPKLYGKLRIPIIQYTLTGIIKGKWHNAMPTLFNENGIEMDFSKRGIYKEKLWLFRKIETFYKLLQNPKSLYKGLTGK